MLKNMLNKIQNLGEQVFRLIADRCLVCGGKLDFWDEKTATCKECGAVEKNKNIS